MGDWLTWLGWWEDVEGVEGKKYVEERRGLVGLRMEVGLWEVVVGGHEREVGAQMWCEGGVWRVGWRKRWRSVEKRGGWNEDKRKGAPACCRDTFGR